MNRRAFLKFLGLGALCGPSLLKIPPAVPPAVPPTAATTVTYLNKYGHFHVQVPRFGQKSLHLDYEEALRLYSGDRW